MSELTVKTDLPDLAEATTLSTEDKAFLRDVAAKIRGVAPEAELLLYGSRARGDAKWDSDWDILAILPERPDLELRHAIYGSFEEYGYEETTYLSVRMMDRARYVEDLPWKAFLYNVHDDAIRL